jgi:hypothetical protein
MEAKTLKLVAYLGLLFLVVWVIASATGKRDQLQKTPQPRQKANGGFFANRYVPAASTLVAAMAIPYGFTS